MWVVSSPSADLVVHVFEDDVIQEPSTSKTFNNPERTLQGPASPPILGPYTGIARPKNKESSAKKIIYNSL